MDIFTVAVDGTCCMRVDALLTNTQRRLAPAPTPNAHIYKSCAQRVGMCVGACRCVLRAHSNAHQKIHALSQQHDCAGMRVTSTCTQTGYIHFHEKPRQFGEIDWANGGLVTSCRTLTIPRPCRQTLNMKCLQTRADALVSLVLSGLSARVQ